MCRHVYTGHFVSRGGTLDRSRRGAVHGAVLATGQNMSRTAVGGTGYEPPHGGTRGRSAGTPSCGAFPYGPSDGRTGLAHPHLPVLVEVLENSIARVMGTVRARPSPQATRDPAQLPRTRLTDGGSRLGMTTTDLAWSSATMGAVAVGARPAATGERRPASATNAVTLDGMAFRNASRSLARGTTTVRIARGALSTSPRVSGPMTSRGSDVFRHDIHIESSAWARRSAATSVSVTCAFLIRRRVNGKAVI